MSFVFAQRPVGFDPVILSGNTVTDIVDATNKAVLVTDFEVNETGGNTPNLTVEIYDGTHSYYLGDDNGATWNAKAVTAKQSLKFTRGYPVPKGSKLRVTSSNASGSFTVVGNQLPTL